MKNNYLRVIWINVEIKGTQHLKQKRISNKTEDKIILPLDTISIVFSQIRILELYQFTEIIVTGDPHVRTQSNYKNNHK